MEISEAKFKLRDVRQARLQARTMVHAFNENKFKEIIDNGLKTSSYIVGESNTVIEEYFFRRLGLVISTFIISILVVAVYLFVRRLERSQNRHSGDTGNTLNKH